MASPIEYGKEFFGVPTEEEAQAFVSEQERLIGRALTAEEKDALAEKYKRESGPGLLGGLGNAALHLGEGAVRGLDYVDGNYRNASSQQQDLKARIINYLSEKSGNPAKIPLLTKDGDTLAALAGRAPTHRDYMDRLGVKIGDLSKVFNDPNKPLDSLIWTDNPNDKRWWKLPTYETSMKEAKANGQKEPSVFGKMADPDAETLIAGGLDVINSPTALISGPLSKAISKVAPLARLKFGKQAGAKVTPYVEKAANYLFGNPMGAIFSSPGKGLYDSGFKSANEVAEKFNKGKTEASKATAASDLMYENGIYGTSRQIRDQAQGLASKMMDEADDILESASKNPEANAVAIFDALKPAREYATKLSKTPGAEDVGRKMLDHLDQLEAPFKKEPGYVQFDASGSMAEKKTLNPKVANESKVYHSNLVEDAARANTPSAFDNFHMLIAGGLRKQTDLALPFDQAKRWKKLNRDAGVLLTADGSLTNTMFKEQRKNMFTPVDGFAFVLGQAAGKAGGIDAVALKQLLNASKTSGARTTIGYGMRKMGENPFLGQFLDDKVTDLYRRNPWTLMDRKDDEQ